MRGLERLLLALDVSARGFALRTVPAGQAASFEGADEPMAHYVLAGDGAFHAPGRRPEPAARDAFILLPRGTACRFEAGADLVLARGAVAATFGGTAGPFDGLPSALTASFVERPMREAFLTLVDETASPGVGGRALTECVVKQALVMLIRDQVEAGAAAPPWMVASRDPKLGRAVEAMLERPADPLTLDALAGLACMSRSAFAERFAAAFGRTPIDFLKDVRLTRAARLLATTDLPVKRIASVVGYESRSYFSRAFRNRYDLDPSDYRVSRLDAA